MRDVHYVGLGAWPPRTILKTTFKMVHSEAPLVKLHKNTRSRVILQTVHTCICIPEKVICDRLTQLRMQR